MKINNKILLILFIIELISIERSSAQVSQEWVQRYHYYIDDGANDIAVDDSGNVYVTGTSTGTNQYPDFDYATIKYNSSGVQLWVQRYNGPGNSTDDARAIAVDDSGNVYVTGLSNRFGFPQNENFDFATIKYNTSGVQQWVRRYGGNGQDGAIAIAVDASGNIYVGGTSAGIGADFTVVKYKSNGDSLWVRSYDSGGNDNGYDYAVAMAVDASGNAYLTGSFGGNNFPAPDWGTVKWNSQGVFQWVQRYNGPGNGADYAKSIAVNDSGNVYVTGYVWGNNNTDYATIKYNSSGVQQWVVFYNGGSIYTAHDQATSITVDDSGNAYVTGWSINSTSATSDYATIKYSSAGVQQWVSRFNGPANSDDMPCCIKLDTAGNVYVTGYATVSLSPTNIDYCTIKYNNSGAQQWVIFYGVGPPQAPNDRATALAVGQSGNVYVTGYSYGDYATIKYSQTIGIEPISNEAPGEFKLYQNYPNPFNQLTIINFQLSIGGYTKLIIYDLLGRETAVLADQDLKAGTYEVSFNGNNLSSGVYFYRLVVSGATPSQDEFSETKKLILIK